MQHLTSSACSPLLIDSTLSGYFSVYAIDIDGDNDTSILGGASNGIVWCENDGLQNLSVNNIGGNTHSLYASDIVNDTDIDNGRPIQAFG